MPLLASCCVMGLLLPLLAPVNGGAAHTVGWLVDLAAHWQWLFLGGLVFSGVAAVRRDRRWLVVLLASPLPWLTASAQAPRLAYGGDTLRVASANIGFVNSEIRPLAGWLASQDIDLVAVIEVSSRSAGALQALPGYPYKEIVPHEGPFGLALLSRHPLSDLQIVRDADGMSHIRARVGWRGQAIELVAIHPMPPVSPYFHARRDDVLRDAAQAVSVQGAPAIVLGDLNATPWSSAFSGLSRHGLRRATGLTPTWPAQAGGLIGIPIDHVLVSAHWTVDATARGPDLGSDHYPVMVSLSLEPAVTASAER